MPIFELDDKTLVPIRRQSIDSGVYEAEIEEWLWDNLEAITGQNLFRIARQPILPSGGRPDIVALDPTGCVVVIEIKRDVDRGQLAQALEYAGWARNTNLDALARHFHGGPESFWADWQDFTGTATPVTVQRQPRLFLVARSLHARTEEAIDFLIENTLPLTVLKMAFCLDDAGRRFLDVEWDKEPEASLAVTVPAPVADGSVPDLPESEEAERRDFREVTLAEVASCVTTPATLTWDRPRKGERYEATLLADGSIRLSTGEHHRSPSGAALAVADVVSYDGWHAWRTPDGRTLDQIRRQLAARPLD